jgi:hypothetical protein
MTIKELSRLANGIGSCWLPTDKAKEEVAINIANSLMLTADRRKFFLQRVKEEIARWNKGMDKSVNKSEVGDAEEEKQD